MAYPEPKSGYSFNPNGGNGSGSAVYGNGVGWGGDPSKSPGVNNYAYTTGADGTQTDQYGQKHKVDAMGNPTNDLMFDTTPGALDPTRDAWQSDPRYAPVVAYLKQHPTGESQQRGDPYALGAALGVGDGIRDNPGQASWGSWGNINDPNSVAAQAYRGLNVQGGTGINAPSPYYTADHTTPVTQPAAADNTVNPLSNPSKDVYNAMAGPLTTPGNAEGFYANHLADPNYVSPDANIGEYYDNARRQAQNGINSTMAAQGKYGSSMMGDLTAGANVNLGAQEARDRSDYLLKASGENRALNQMGMSGAATADAQTTSQIGMLGTLANNASSQTLGQEKEQWNETSTLGLSEGDASKFWDSLGINSYIDLTDKSNMALLGSYKSAVDNNQKTIDQARDELSQVLSVTGKFQGGGSGSSGSSSGSGTT